VIPANSNVALLMASSRVVVQPLSFASMTPAMQNAMIEWQEEKKTGFSDVLSNTAVVGRMTVLYDPMRAVVLNAGSLTGVLVNAGEKLEMVRMIAGSLDNLDRPRALQCRLVGAEPSRMSLIVLPILLDGTPIHAISVAGW